MAKTFATTTSIEAGTSPFGWTSLGALSKRPSLFEKICRAFAIAAICIAPISDMMQSDHDASESGVDKNATASQQSKSQSHRIDATRSKELMIAGYGGVPYTYPSDVHTFKNGVRDFTVKNVSWDGQPFKSPIYYGIRVVRWANEQRFGSMLDFTHSKTISRLADQVTATGKIDGQPVPESGPLKALFERLEFSHGHNMLSVNGLMRFGKISENILPYVGIGAGVNLPHSEVQVQGDPKRSYEYQYTGPMAQGLVGIEFRLAKISYFFEYKFTVAKYLVPLTGQDGTEIGLFGDLYRQGQRWWSGTEPTDGWLSTDLNSHNPIAGVGVRVGK